MKGLPNRFYVFHPSENLLYIFFLPYCIFFLPPSLWYHMFVLSSSICNTAVVQVYSDMAYWCMVALYVVSGMTTLLVGIPVMKFATQ